LNGWAGRRRGGRSGGCRVRVNYKRLQETKKKYDPQNFFRMNQNIKPLA
jgi:hypothetical protein